MKHISTSQYLLFLALALTLALFSASAQTKIKEVSAHAPDTADGKALFTEYCAVCHGVDGKGHGPAAEGLKKFPGDLTLLTRSHNGAFPGNEIQLTIASGGGFLAHGTKEMPMWGHIFSGFGVNEGLGTMRVYNVMKYIEQLQAH